MNPSVVCSLAGRISNSDVGSVDGWQEKVRLTDVFSENVDVIIVGSGPAGSAYARSISEQWRAARILMLEAGPLVSDPPGYHLSNIADDTQREMAQMGAQGPHRGLRYAPISEREQQDRREGRPDGAMLRRPGLFAVGSGALDGNGFPAAHAASSVGGMGAQWFGACPRPSASERIAFIGDAEMDDALTRAESLLRVSSNQFPDFGALRSLEARLGQVFNADRRADRFVQRMPMALEWTEERLFRTGTDVVLGPLLSAPSMHFELRADTVCRRLIVQGDRVIGVQCEGNGVLYQVGAKAVVVAADSLHTPQLLFASGIRPPALGRYLNEHLLLIVGLQPKTGETTSGGIIANAADLSRVAGVIWVPYIGAEFPFEIEITALLPGAEAGGGAAVDDLFLNVHLYTHSDLQLENRVTFSEKERDWRGLPAMSFHFELSRADKERLGEGKRLLAKMADALGYATAASTARITPAGTSLHYQGTVRMGERDDGQSVCDRHSKVWGFHNLYVAGNGLIPTETAANPTLTSVALSFLGADDLVRRNAAWP